MYTGTLYVERAEPVRKLIIAVEVAVDASTLLSIMYFVDTCPVKL